MEEDKKQIEQTANNEQTNQTIGNQQLEQTNNSQQIENIAVNNEKENEGETNTIDLSKFSLWSETPEPDIENSIFQETESTIWQEEQQSESEKNNFIAQLNAIQENNEPDIDIANIVIEDSKPKNEQTNILWDSWIWEQALEQKVNKKIEKIMVAYIVIGISIISIFIISLYNKYISATVDSTIENQTLVEKMKTITKTISEHTNINDYALYSKETNIMINDKADTKTKEIVQSKKLNYLHKKDILEKNMETLVDQTIKNAQKIDKIKKEIIKYGFIPKQLYDTVETKQWTNGIKKRIALMENIRFITAFKTFSYMESFIEGLANNMNKDISTVEAQIKKAVIDAEKDLVIYTNTCFLNPYELTNNCNVVWDFDNYYKIIDTQRNVDTDFIKQLAAYIDNKLQETNVPTFNIDFLKFNPKEDNIDFIIDINTSTQDEIAINKKGILNPHVFIVTNLINLLKQSLLVIWEWIKADQIKTSPKIIRVGSTVFTVNNSTINLSLPVQKGSQREISDFFSNKY